MSTTIQSIKLTEAPPTREMYVRPWTINNTRFKSSEELNNMLGEVTNFGTNLTANALAPIANSILVPDARADRVANIGGSYGDRRFAVEIIVKTISSDMLENYEIITGYTDHYGLIVSPTGNLEIDPNMILMINGVADVEFSNYAGNTSWGVKNISQILTPVIGVSGGETIVDKNMVACRPTDVLSTLGAGAMSVNSNRTTINSMMLSSSSRRSNRTNNVSANFLGKTMEAYRNNMLDADDDSNSALLSAAASHTISDPALSTGVFLNSLRQRTQFAQERAITWKELNQIDPTLRTDGNDPRITVVELTTNAQDTLRALASSSAYWNSAYNETLVGQQAVSAIPAWMSTHGIGELTIEAHNATVTGEAVVNIHSIRGIKQGVDLRPLLNRLKASFSEAVFAQLRAGNNIGVLYIKASMGLVGIANVEVSINGGEKVPFNTALFNDASWSPCIAGNIGSLDYLASDIGTICANITNQALGSNLDYQQMMDAPKVNHAPIAFNQSVPVVGQQQTQTGHGLTGGLHLNINI